MSIMLSDIGDGGLQSDRWPRGPEVVRCDRKSGRENSLHGVSEQQQTLKDSEQESLTCHK